MKTSLVIIDDSKAVHDLVAASLAEDDYSMKHAFDGETGLTMVGAVRPDLVLLDIDMPGMSGFEVCKRIKADPTTAPIGVVFLTAAGSVEDRVHGLSLRSDDYILKPFDPRELSLRIRSVLRHLRMGRILQKMGLDEPAADLNPWGVRTIKFPELMKARNQNPWNRSAPVESAEPVQTSLSE